MSKLGSGELENQVLDVLWASTGPLTPREVCGQLSQHREIAYTTVMTTLVRLWRKGTVERQSVGRTFAYRPGISREERVAARMQELLCGPGDGSAALARFVGFLEPHEVADLREVLRKAEGDR